MLLTLTTTASLALRDTTDLGFLVHKHPDRVSRFDTSVGTATVLWPEASDARSTVALVLEVDPVALVRGRGPDREGFSLAQHVNDRPYAASSMLSVALGKAFRTAMAGRCDARPELVDTPLPLEVHLPAVPARGGAGLVRRLFEPLGWTVTTTAVPLDETVPAWGASPYVDLRLVGTGTVAAALTQVYVLLPVLDDGKHYWVSGDEVDKLLRAGGAWLPAHPERELITRRYLRHARPLVEDAVARLDGLDDLVAQSPSDLPRGGGRGGSARATEAATYPSSPEGEEVPEDDEEREPQATPLRVQRLTAVVDALLGVGAASVVDLGCGEGALLRELVRRPTFARILGVDVSHRALETAARRLHLDRMSDTQRARLELLQSSVVYRDDRLAGFDAMVLMEVVEHVDPPRLPALARNVFGHARPETVVLTTPNVEHNVRYADLPAGKARHADHRFEWTRAELRAWADAAAATYGYTVTYAPVGPDDPEVGPPTQLALFRRVG